MGTNEGPDLKQCAYEPTAPIGANENLYVNERGTGLWFACCHLLPCFIGIFQWRPRESSVRIPALLTDMATRKYLSCFHYFECPSQHKMPIQCPCLEGSISSRMQPKMGPNLICVPPYLIHTWMTIREDLWEESERNAKGFMDWQKISRMSLSSKIIKTSPKCFDKVNWLKTDRGRSSSTAWWRSAGVVWCAARP